MSEDTIDVLCNGDTYQYELPEVWPVCSSQAICNSPYVNSGVMQVTLSNKEKEYIEENDKVRCVY